jgi:Holliday junction resolvase RusA-like endonuclease
MKTLTIPGKPVGKGRPRMTKSGHVYTPAPTENYEAYIKALWVQEHGSEVAFPVEAVMLSVSVYMAIPQSTSKKRREAMLDGVIMPTKKPDLDNVLKIIADALNGLAYTDDKQIVGVTMVKGYSEHDSIDVAVKSFGEIILVAAGEDPSEYARMRAGG